MMLDFTPDKELMHRISVESKKEINSTYSIEMCARRMEEVYGKVLS